VGLSSLLMGIIPLVIFVVIDSFAGVKAGVISAVVFALLEAAYTYYTMRRIDEITCLSLALVAVFGFLSYHTENPLIFKLQPVILGGILGIAALVMQYMDMPYLVLMANKYKDMFPEELKKNLSNPFVVEQFRKISLYTGFGFLLHAGLVGYSAFYMSNWWWIAIRGIGFSVIMGLCMVLPRLI
jgi:intracellular septation protein A